MLYADVIRKCLLKYTETYLCLPLKSSMGLLFRDTIYGTTPGISISYLVRELGL
jgi:hypothetical protein